MEEKKNKCLLFQTPIEHEPLKNEFEDEIESLPASKPIQKKAPAPPPPPPVTAHALAPAPVETFPSKRTVSQSAGESLYYPEEDSYSSVQRQSRRSLSRQNHQRHGSADLLCRQINHEYMNRSSTTNASFYPSDNYLPNQMNYYEYEPNNDAYVQQLVQELKLTKEQLNATMKSIKTFWSPELKKERALRKDESCLYQLYITEHQKRSKQVREEQRD